MRNSHTDIQKQEIDIEGGGSFKMSGRGSEGGWESHLGITTLLLNDGGRPW